MPKSANDVVTLSLGHLGVIQQGGSANPEQLAYGKALLDGAFAQMQADHGLAFTWDLSSIPDDYFLPLSWLVASDTAPRYSVAYRPRSYAIGHILSLSRPDDRDDPAPTDPDELAAEVAEKEAQFF